MQISRPTRGFCFGPFELDSDTGELRSNGTPVHLQPQPTHVLRLLLENHGKLVTREQIQQQVWTENTFVEFEIGLNQAIKKLRDALGDSVQEPVYIETIPRKGYRFIADVEEIAHHAPNDPLLGHVLGHFRLVERIGQGGMGIVYRAHDEHLNRDVAIKILPQGAVADETSRRRFRKEAMALSKLNHPNIASVSDFDSQDGMDFLVEELIPGTSLDHMLKVGPLTEKQVVDFGSQLCQGLSAAHEQGVIHRDIKPANLRVTPDGRLKILDFGLATVMHAPKTETQSEVTASVVEVQTTSGTVPYMAPEQLMNETLDARTDIWAAGCVLYEMATGKLPFAGVGTALTDAILHQPPSPPSSLNHKLSLAIEAIILKSLEKDPALRYASARDVAVDLHRLSTGAITHALIVRKRTLAAPSGVSLCVAIFLVASAVGFWWYLKHHIPQFAHQPVAVVQFRNLTQDPQLEWLSSGMPEMLTTNLGQVTGIDVLSPERLATAEKRLKKQKPSAAPTATEIAEEAGAKLFVIGSVMKVSSAKLVVEIRMQEVSTGKVIFTETMEGENIASIFPMTNSATDRLSKLLVPKTELPALSPAVEQVLTENTDALRHFQAGADYQRRFFTDEALREYDEAIRLDPQFALGYLAKYFCYKTLADLGNASAMLSAVEPLQSRLPRRTQFYFQAEKAALAGDTESEIRIREGILRQWPRSTGTRISLAQIFGFGQVQRSIVILREGLALDPKDDALWNQLVYVLSWAGDEAAAREAFEHLKAIAGPNEPNPWGSWGDALYVLGRDDEAAAAYRKVVELKPDFVRYSGTLRLAIIHSDQGESTLAVRELGDYRQRTSPPAMQLDAAIFEAQLLESQGAPEAALPIYRDTIPQLVKAKETLMARNTLGVFAIESLLLGQREAALRFAKQQNLHGAQFEIVSLLEAAAGNETAAEVALEHYKPIAFEAPRFVIEQQRMVNKALILLNLRDRGAAVQTRAKIDGAKVVDLYSLTSPGRVRAFLLFRAQARLLAKNYEGAEQDLRLLQRLLRFLNSYRSLRVRSPLMEHLCHFYLGQVYEGTGKRDEAFREYQSFLSHYTNSRARLPQIAEARAAVKRQETQSNR